LVETVSVEDAFPPAERETLVGLSDAVGPVGETDAVNDTVPEKPPRLATVIADVPEAVAARLR